jgi:hypothetical protein
MIVGALCQLPFETLAAAWGTAWQRGEVGIRSRRLQRLRPIRIQWRSTAFRLIVRGYDYAKPAASCQPQDLANTFSSVCWDLVDDRNFADHGPHKGLKVNGRDFGR